MPCLSQTKTNTSGTNLIDLSMNEYLSTLSFLYLPTSIDQLLAQLVFLTIQWNCFCTCFTVVVYYLVCSPLHPQ